MTVKQFIENYAPALEKHGIVEIHRVETRYQFSFLYPKHYVKTLAHLPADKFVKHEEYILIGVILEHMRVKNVYSAINDYKDTCHVVFSNEDDNPEASGSTMLEAVIKAALAVLGGEMIRRFCDVCGKEIMFENANELPHTLNMVKEFDGWKAVKMDTSFNSHFCLDCVIKALKSYKEKLTKTPEATE